MMRYWREFYEEIYREFKKMLTAYKLQDEEVICRIVPKRAVGGPLPGVAREVAAHYFNMLSKENVLITGKGLLVRGTFADCCGDSSAEDPKPFRGKLSEVCNMVFGKNPDRAVFFAALNVVYNYLRLNEAVVHCRGDEPKACGKLLAKYITKHFGKNAVVAHIGYKPEHVEACSKFRGYVTDLDPENVGKVKFKKKILSADKNEEVIKNADVACISGSAIINGSLPHLLAWCERYGTVAIVYGVTASTAAKIMHLRHFCPYARRRP
jgi:uncharacterized protein (DUF4213/DUF364 family)